MTLAEQYRNLAAGLRDKIRSENSEQFKAEWENLAQSYLRLAEQAELHDRTDLASIPIFPDQSA
jgi:hypothetical protein